MATLTVLYAGELTKDRSWPPIMEAARYVGLCRRQRIERIRVERVNGALINEFTLPQLESFLRTQGLAWQPDQVLVPGQDLEPRPLIVSGWTKEP